MKGNEIIWIVHHSFDFQSKPKRSKRNRQEGFFEDASGFPDAPTIRGSHFNLPTGLMELRFFGDY